MFDGLTDGLGLETGRFMQVLNGSCTGLGWRFTSGYVFGLIIGRFWHMQVLYLEGFDSCGYLCLISF